MTPAICRFCRHEQRQHVNGRGACSVLEIWIVDAKPGAPFKFRAQPSCECGRYRAPRRRRRRKASK